MIRYATLTLAMAALAGNAVAAQKSTLEPAPDSHIRVETYSPMKRITVTGLIDQPTTISFPPTEAVYDVLQTSMPNPSLDPNASPMAPWFVPSAKARENHPFGANLTLWPKHVGESILTVITCPGTEMGTCASPKAQKVYSFKLVALDDPTGKPDVPDTTFNLLIKDGHAFGSAPAELTPAAGAAKARRKRQREAEEQAAADERLRADSFRNAPQGPSGCHFRGQGDVNSPIKPLCPISNGIWTMFRFPGLSAKPSIYIGDICDGDPAHERLPRQHSVGDFIVVDEIAPRFCLRKAPYALAVINDAYNPAGTPTGTGTISPTVTRAVIPEGASP